MSDLYQILYVSSAVKLFSEDELSAVLRHARQKNAAHDLTGMLLYEDGNFIQLLEGPKAGVKATWSRIAKDPRHRGFYIMAEGPIDKRICADWAMGFKNANDVGSFQLDWETLEQRLGEDAPIVVRVMMETFYNSSRTSGERRSVGLQNAPGPIAPTIAS